MFEKRRKSHLTTSQEDNHFGSCSNLDQMTNDELRKIYVGNGFDENCPICKKFHLTKREIVLLEMMLT